VTALAFDPRWLFQHLCGHAMRRMWRHGPFEFRAHSLRVCAVSTRLTTENNAVTRRHPRALRTANTAQLAKRSCPNCALASERSCGVGGHAPGRRAATPAALHHARHPRFSKSCGGPTTRGRACRLRLRCSPHYHPHYSRRRSAPLRRAPAPAGDAVGGGAVWRSYCWSRRGCPAQVLRARLLQLGRAPGAATAIRAVLAAAVGRGFLANVLRSIASDMPTAAETRRGTVTALCSDRTDWRRARRPPLPTAGD